MKKYIFFILAIALFWSGCHTSKEEKPTLIVSIEPQRFFLESLVGEHFKVHTLVPVGTSPETYDPAPSQMVALNKSKAYFKVGKLGFENTWTNVVLETLPDVKIVDCSKGIALLDNDPHVWTSPENALIISKNMLDALVELDPQNETDYLQNFETLMQKIKNTDIRISAMLKDSLSRAFIIYHPDLSYFAKQYGFTQIGMEHEGKHPSPTHLKALIDRAKQDKIYTIFIQKGFDTKHAEIIAQETGAELFTINPLAYAWDNQLIELAQILSRK